MPDLSATNGTRLSMSYIKLNADICCFTETWVSENKASSYLYRDFTSFYKCRADRKGGGVMALINSTFNPVMCTSTGDDAMSVTLEIDGCHYLLSLVYRPPDAIEQEN